MKEIKQINSASGQINVLKKHIRYSNGNAQTVCVSSVLSFLGITPDMYRYTYSKKGGIECYHSVLRKNGYCVRSRATQFKRCKTVNQVLDSMEYFIDPINKGGGSKEVFYMVWVTGHLFLIDSKGKVMVDTAPTRAKGDRRKVIKITAVFKK